MIARLIVIVSFACVASRAHAFSDPARFEQAPLEGGSDGRYFTGSRSDPFSCGVCHEGGEPPQLTLEGLPDVLERGERYDVTIRWSDPEVSHALALELTDESGAHAQVVLPAAEDVTIEQRCERDLAADIAAYAVDVDERRIVGVTDCGASELRFAFTAPERSPLYLSMGIVRSDSSGTPEGDGVVELRRLIGAPSARAASCSAAPMRSGSGHGGIAFALVLAALWRRRVRAVRSWLARALIALSLTACYEPRVPADAPTGDAAAPDVEAFAAILDASRPDDGRPTVVCPADPSALSTLDFAFRSRSVGGRFRPRNAGAVWVEDANGTWVKTLERWAGFRAKYLTHFVEASGGDLTDAVTSATLSMHQVHELTWDLTDVDGCEVPNGSYALRMEVTDASRTGVAARVPFEKTDEPLSFTPDDVEGFREMSVRLE